MSWNKKNNFLIKIMTDIQEIPVDPPEANIENPTEIINNTDIDEENTNIPEPEAPAVKQKIKKKPLTSPRN